MTRKPSSVRAVRFPAAYGAPGGPDSLLPWSYVEERVRVESNYWNVDGDAWRRPR